MKGERLRNKRGDYLRCASCDARWITHDGGIALRCAACGYVWDAQGEPRERFLFRMPLPTMEDSVWLAGVCDARLYLFTSGRLHARAYISTAPGEVIERCRHILGCGSIKRLVTRNTDRLTLDGAADVSRLQRVVFPYVTDSTRARFLGFWHQMEREALR